MNLLSKISLPIILSLITPKGDDGAIFNRQENEKYLITNYMPMNFFSDNPMIIDGVYAEYDKDTNGLSEHCAVYRILSQDSLYYYPDSLACLVGVDKEQDGKLDLFLIDKDDNGTLETVINIENFIEEEKKEKFKVYI